MKGKLALLLSKIAAGKAATIIVPVVGVTVAAVVGAGAYIGIQSSKAVEDNDELQVTVEVVDAVVEPEVKLAIPEYMRCLIEGSSIEKDLTLAIADEWEHPIEGEEFEIKLIQPKDADSLIAFADSIKSIDDKISAIEEIYFPEKFLGEELEENEEKGEGDNQEADIIEENMVVVEDVSLVGDQSESDADTAGLTQDVADKLTALYEDKEIAMEAYNTALEGVKGDYYTDGDMDGKMHIEKIDAGDYVACLVLKDTYTNNYTPVNYLTEVNVKDTLKFEVVQNIKSTVKKYSKSEDKVEVTTKVEEKLSDTVAFVESNKVGGTAAASPKKLVASVSSKKNTKTITLAPQVTPEAKVYTATIRYLDENGNEIQGATSQEIKGDYKISPPSIAGYEFDMASDNASGKAEGDITVNFRYKKLEEAPETQPDDNSNSENPQGAGDNTTGSAFSRIFASFFKGGAVACASNVGVDKTLAVSESATIYSVEGANQANLLLEYTGFDLSDITVSSSDSAVAATIGQGVITVKGSSTKDVKATITVTAKSNGNPVLSVTSIVTLIGSANDLKDEAGNLLYKDNKGSQKATIADYKEGGSYYRLTDVTYYGWQTINDVRYYYDANGNKVTGQQIISGTKYNFGSDGALMTSGTGIDVSLYQGKIDWSQVKTAVGFAIMRCGYRGKTDHEIHEDSMFLTNMKGAKANGIKTGVYIYSRAVNEAEAVAEASYAVAMANAAGGCSYPIYIDMESNDQASLSNGERTAIINAFCQTVQSAGYSAGVYANRNWLTNNINTSSLSSNISIWCAQYASKCSYSGRYGIWQYTSTGSVPGIKGNVDMDISYF